MKVEEKIRHALEMTLKELEEHMRKNDMKFKINPKWFIKKVMDRAGLK